MIVYHSSPNEFSEFDLSKVGQTTEVNKYGFGFYFGEDKEDVETHAFRNILKGSPIFIYEVKVLNSNTIVEYESSVPDSVLFKIYHHLQESEISDLNELYEEYGLNFRELYDYLKSSYDNKTASRLLDEADITGFKIENTGWYNSAIYLIFSPSNLRIQDVEQIR